jgi:serine/threonine protein kinase
MFSKKQQERCQKFKIKQDTYIIKSELGRGAFGITYLVTKKGDLTDESYVLKSLKLKQPNKPQKNALDIKEIFRELNLLKYIVETGCQPDILCYFDYFIDCENQTVNIITKAFQNAITLTKFIQDYKSLSIFLDHKTLLKIMYNISKALNHLHILGIAHGDIKPDNILINENTFDIQIIDFGLACSKNCKPGGTLMYSSPEILKAIFTQKTFPFEEMKRSDVFSLGIVFYVLANFDFPYPIEGFSPFKTDFGSNYSTSSSIEVTTPAILEYQPININDQLILRGQLLNFYTNKQNRIISFYNNNKSKLDIQINEFIESMLNITLRPTMKQVFEKIQKLITMYNELNQQIESPIKFVSTPLPSPPPTTPIDSDQFFDELTLESFNL